MTRSYAPMAVLLTAFSLLLVLIPARAQDGVAFRAATLLGGTAPEDVAAVAVAPDGTVYVAGTTESADFPATPGAFDTTLGGEADAFVARFSADLSTLLAATYVGGDTGAFPGSTFTLDEGYALTVAADGLYLVGFTYTIDFPVTPGAFDTTHNGSPDVFVARLSLDLSTIDAATYLGGDRTELGTTVALDGTDVVVSGFTLSDDFPFTPGAFSNDAGTFGGPFIARLSGDLATLQAATALGDQAVPNALAVDPATGDVVIGGHVTGPSYPVTPDAFDQTCGTDSFCDLGAFGNVLGDGFVSRLDRGLTTLLASTFLGGGESDAVEAIALRPGEIIVSGDTGSRDFPTTPGAYQTGIPTSIIAFPATIVRFDDDLTSEIAGTLVYGVEDLSGASFNGLGLNADGDHLFAVGRTTSAVFPLTAGAFDTTLEGLIESVLVEMSLDLSTLTFSSFLGGNDPDAMDGQPDALAFARSGSDLYFAGLAVEEDFPATPGAAQTALAGTRDGYVARVSTDAAVRVTVTPVSAPVVIPADGGSFSFELTLTNVTDQPQPRDAWTAATGPVDRSPLLGPRAVTLAPGATLTRTVTQRVPAAAPGGAYTYFGQAGGFPSEVLTAAFFPVVKQGTARVAGGAAVDWSASGWDGDAATASATLPADAPRLAAVYPNPTRDRATISYSLVEAADVRLAVYDVLGREVAVLVDAGVEAGAHRTVFDATGLAAGTYFWRLVAGDHVQMGRVRLTR